MASYGFNAPLKSLRLVFLYVPVAAVADSADLHRLVRLAVDSRGMSMLGLHCPVLDRLS